MTKYKELGSGMVKRKEKREIALFIDGSSLDRATRRLQRKVDLEALVKGVTSGLTPAIARYYTLVPHEDDSRQSAFLDAVAKAGLDVIIKRLPPKAVNRQISLDAEMSADMVAYALGKSTFSDLNQHIPQAYGGNTGVMGTRQSTAQAAPEEQSTEAAEASRENINKVVTVVCASRELSYTFALLKEYGVETVNADFGKFNSGDLLKSASKWIDLSDSETIWREV